MTKGGRFRLSQRLFKEEGGFTMDATAMYRLSYGLFVLSAREGEKDNGCIVNTVTQMTSEPNLIGVTVNKKNLTRDMILHTERFSVSVLDQTVPFDWIRRFGFQSGRTTDKLADFDEWERGANGIFSLTNHTNAVLRAEVTSHRELSTHTLFLAVVHSAERLSDEPSVTYDYYQKNIKPKPQKIEKKGWRCKVCGYVYEGETLPEGFQCPICGHGAQDFERIG